MVGKTEIIFRRVNSKSKCLKSVQMNEYICDEVKCFLYYTMVKALVCKAGISQSAPLLLGCRPRWTSGCSL